MTETIDRQETSLKAEEHDEVTET